MTSHTLVLEGMNGMTEGHVAELVDHSCCPVDWLVWNLSNGGIGDQMSQPKKPRDRQVQKLVRERMEKTGEPYQLAWRRVTGIVPDNTEPSLQRDWSGPSIMEVEAWIRRSRAAAPLHRGEYALEITEREAAFGFCKRLVMVPRRLAYEPDRMPVVAVELFGIGGHFFAVKLEAGSYEIRGLEMHGPMETLSSLDDLEQRYGSYRQIAPDPAVPWSGTEDSNTHFPRGRLARAITQRFRLRDFAGAVYFADPTTGGAMTSLMVHFGPVEFEIIDAGARYARFFLEYIGVPPRDHQPDGRLRGEVTWSVESTTGDEQKLMDDLTLVELHATSYRPVGQRTETANARAPFLAMMQHLREHTGDVELEGEVAYLYVLKGGRRDHKSGPALQAPMSSDERKHLVRAGAWWRIDAREQNATG